MHTWMHIPICISARDAREEPASDAAGGRQPGHDEPLDDLAALQRRLRVQIRTRVVFCTVLRQRIATFSRNADGARENAPKFSGVMMTRLASGSRVLKASNPFDDRRRPDFTSMA